MGLFNRFFSPGTWDNWLVCFSDLPLSVKSLWVNRPGSTIPRIKEPRITFEPCPTRTEA